jgi:hypothetical protein
MTSDQPDSEVTALAQERLQVRAAKDFARADELRDAIAGLGWVVTDTPDGFALNPKPPFEVYANLGELAQRVSLEPAAVSIAVIVDGWPDDVRTCFGALLSHAPSDARIIGLDCGNVNGAGEVLAELDPRIVDLHVQQTNPGWSSAVATLLERAASDVVVLMDMSTVLEGDGITPLVQAVSGDVVAAAWQGVDVDLADEWRSFEPAGPGEVDAFLGYCVAVNRAFAIGHPPHAKARFYRNADMEWSFILRAAGGRIVVPSDALPMRQDRHRGYHDSDPQVRDRESKRTYDRFLSAFRGRKDLLHPR